MRPYFSSRHGSRPCCAHARRRARRSKPLAQRFFEPLQLCDLALRGTASYCVLNDFIYSHAYGRYGALLVMKNPYRRVFVLIAAVILKHATVDRSEGERIDVLIAKIRLYSEAELKLQPVRCRVI